MSTPTQLSLYNGALYLLGEEKLASVNENREPRHVLDQFWNNGAVDYCLEQGLWNFAIRSVKAEADSSITPDWGFQKVFLKPSDWIKTAVVCSDEYFRNPLTNLDWRDEVGYWFSNLEELYIRYVSNNSSYGQNLALWPKTFERFVEAYLAKMAGPRIKGVSAEKIKLAEALYDKLESGAKSSDASNDGAAVQPDQSWAVARRNGRGGRRDWGSRSRLTG